MSWRPLYACASSEYTLFMSCGLATLSDAKNREDTSTLLLRRCQELAASLGKEQRNRKERQHVW